MNFVPAHFAAPPRDYPNALSAPRPLAMRFESRGWILLGLFLLTLLPRIVMACKLTAICPDGIFYIQLATAIENGQWNAAMTPMWLNVYPLVLAALHQLGLDWQTAAALWGVTLASLTVLPLYGWVRRQFDDRVAFVAGFLYAIHPKLIEWSPEIIRDQTFWFLAALTLYTGWRAVTEVSLRWYAATGVTITLAVLTRFEGWFLLIPLVLWSVSRGWALTGERRRVAFGLALSLAMLPLLMGTVHFTWLRDVGRPPWAVLSRLEYVVVWAQNAMEGKPKQEAPPTPSQPQPAAAPIPEPPQAAVAPPSSTRVTPPANAVIAISAATAPVPVVESAAVTLPIAPLVPARMTTRKAAWKFLDTMRRGLDSVFALLMFGGIWKWRHLWSRRDHQPLFYVALCVMAGVWVHLWYSQETSSRYGLLIALAGIPFASLGLISLSAWIVSLSHVLPYGRPRQATIFGTMFTIVAIVGLSDALTSHDPTRDTAVAMGRWVRDAYGPGRFVAFTRGDAMMTYYAQGPGDELPLRDGLQRTVEWLNRSPADLVIIRRKHVPSGMIDPLVAALRQLAVVTVSEQQLPPECRPADWVVLRRVAANDTTSRDNAPRDHVQR